MKYYNIKTREIREFTQEELEIENNNNKWIEYDIILNKIVIVSMNNYKVFPKDELGLNAKKIIPLLEYFKPVSKESALKIGKYYKICPYCLGKLENKNNVLILDCREDFSNIKKMQLNIYNEVFCCNNTYLIPFAKTKSNKEKANFIECELEQDKNFLVSYKIKSLGVEILIDLLDVLEIDLSSDYEIMQKIFKDKSYLAIKNDNTIETEEIVIDDLEQQILYYLSRR